MESNCGTTKNNSPVNEDVITAVRRILEIAAEEGVSIAPALSRGLAEALQVQAPAHPKGADTVPCFATTRNKANKANENEKTTASTRQSLDLGSRHASAGASTCTDAVRSASLAARQSLDLGSAGLRSGTEKTASSPCRCEARHNDSTACNDGIITVSGYYTPEEAAELIGKIRDWLSGCREGHRLADLMESIKQKFHLYDSQLGELLGISDRLVGHVRHGRPSPFVLARFTEVFGEAGGADKDRG